MNTQLFQHAMTADLVRLILKDSLKFNWSLQGFGMLRLYLSDDTRLHVWDSRYRNEGVSDIHTHPWDFTSYVVGGRITDQVYVEVEDYNGPKLPIRDIKTYNKSVILCGPGGGIKGEPDKVTLGMIGRYTYNSGDTYTHLDHDIHCSIPAGGTVTVVHRRKKADPDHALVYWEEGKEWGTAEPRPATPDEVSHITSLALERWF